MQEPFEILLTELCERGGGWRPILRSVNLAPASLIHSREGEGTRLKEERMVCGEPHCSPALPSLSSTLPPAIFVPSTTFLCIYTSFPTIKGGNSVTRWWLGWGHVRHKLRIIFKPYPKHCIILLSFCLHVPCSVLATSPSFTIFCPLSCLLFFFPELFSLTIRFYVFVFLSFFSSFFLSHFLIFFLSHLFLTLLLSSFLVS
jgi:hypothetical protein